MRLGKISFTNQIMVANNGIEKQLFKEIIDFLPGDARFAGFVQDPGSAIQYVIIQSGIFKDLPDAVRYVDIPDIEVNVRKISPFQPPIIDSVDYTKCLDTVITNASLSTITVTLPISHGGKSFEFKPIEVLAGEASSFCIHQQAFYNGLTKTHKYCSKCGINL